MKDKNATSSIRLFFGRVMKFFGVCFGILFLCTFLFLFKWTILQKSMIRDIRFEVLSKKDVKIETIIEKYIPIGTNAKDALKVLNDNGWYCLPSKEEIGCTYSGLYPEVFFISNVAYLDISLRNGKVSKIITRYESTGL